MSFFKLSSLPLRKSVLLISGAILVSTAVQAEIRIGRLPSIHAGDGQSIDTKPNVFLIIDNNESMGRDDHSSKKMSSEGNYLQQTAGALIAALPQLEGKVRIGVSTPFRGSGKTLRFGDLCKDLKLNGNVNRVAPYIPGLKDDLAKNKNYVTGNEDYVFGEWGSGYGQTAPREFSGNYARYLYSWLGAMCPGSTNERDNKLPYGIPPNKGPAVLPPYGDLRDPVAYKEAARAAGNEFSIPLINWADYRPHWYSPKKPPVYNKTHNPILDVYSRVLGEVSDKEYLCSITKANSTKNGKRCGYTNIDAETKTSILRKFPDGEMNYFTYDAYAPSRQDNGYPDNKNPVSCRKNYTIIVSAAPYSVPDYFEDNIEVGTDKGGLDGLGNWIMPNGQKIPITGGEALYTRQYRYLPLSGISGKVWPIPEGSYVAGKRYWIQGAAGSFLFSKLALRTYYSDLRKDLKNDVMPFYAVEKPRPEGINGEDIPTLWDRKNDIANWQNMSIFSLGFQKAFYTWSRAQIYNSNFRKLDKSWGPLEAYYRAVESGMIFKDNNPLYDWGRGGFGKIFPDDNRPSGTSFNRYIYRNPNNQTERFKIAYEDFYASWSHNNLISNRYLDALGALGEMDYAKAAVNTRGMAFPITDYDSVKKVIQSIASRIEDAIDQGITGGAISGGGRVTASQQSAGGNDSILFTTYLDQENLSGNIFAFKNCPLIQEKIRDEEGNLIQNPEWGANNCGQRLWNAATVLHNDSSIERKTIVPKEKSDNTLTGVTFTWDELDQKLKDKFKIGGNEQLGKARVEWVNGKLQSEFNNQPEIANKLRKRSTIRIPKEKQNYKRNPDGSLEKDKDGNIVLADPTDIPNLMGEIVYALPKVVDNRGTLPAAHPLRSSYEKEFFNTVKNRKTLVLAGANDGRLYGFSTANSGENASLAFSFIPREVILKDKPNNIVDFTKPNATGNQESDGLVNGPFTVRDAQVNGKWGTYVVGTLGEGGDAIYALDISNGQASEQMFKWEVSGRGYGNIMVEPRIVWLRFKTDVKSDEPIGKWVVIVPTGYNADSVSLVILDLANGDEIAKINTMAKYKENGSTPEGNKICSFDDHSQTEKSPLGTETIREKLKSLGDVYLPPQLTCDNGLGQLTVFDADSDSGADFVFAGDLLGHVWKFDLRDALDSVGQFQKEKLKIAYNSPLFIAQTPLEIPSNSNLDEKKVATAAKKSTRQPITAMITIDDGAYGEGSMLYFGTGRMFNQEERGLEQQQSFYGVWDIPRYSDSCKKDGTECNEDSPYSFSLPLRRNPALAKSEKYDFIRYETFNISTDKVADKNNSSLKYYDEIRGLKRTDQLESSAFLSFDLKGKQRNPDDKAVGWIIDFPVDNAIERVINRAYSFEDNIFFSSFSPKGSHSVESCKPIRSGVGGDARFYMVDRLTGKQLEKSPFDFNNDGTQDDEKGKDGVKFTPGDLGKGGDLKKLSYDKEVDTREECEKNSDPDYNCEEGTISLSPASIMIGKGAGDFLSVIGVLERSKQATDKHNCDYNRQIIFPSTADPITGNPRVLSSCNRNRYRVWKQPAIE